MQFPFHMLCSNFDFRTILIRYYYFVAVLDEDLTPEDVIIQMRELRGPRAVQSVKQYNFINEFRELCHKAESLEYEDEGCVSR